MLRSTLHLGGLLAVLLVGLGGCDSVADAPDTLDSGRSGAVEASLACQVPSVDGVSNITSPRGLRVTYTNNQGSDYTIIQRKINSGAWTTIQSMADGSSGTHTYDDSNSYNLASGRIGTTITYRAAQTCTQGIYGNEYAVLAQLVVSDPVPE